MEINSINIQTIQAGSSLPPAGTADTASVAKSKQAALADAASSAGNAAVEQIHRVISSDYIKDQIEAILFSFPPYFPVGSPQRIDLIKGVKGVQDEIKSSKLPKEVKDKLAGQELTDTSTDKEISTALQGIKQYTTDNSPSPAPSTDTGQPVKIVSIQV